MARATMSRGASEARSSYFSIKEAPSRVRRMPPKPRTASEIRKVGFSPAGLYRPVGWNCTNSMFSSLPLARYTMAMPSPVAIVGLVVFLYTCPVPPVQSTVTLASMVSIWPVCLLST